MRQTLPRRISGFVFLVQGMLGIIDGVMQSPALLALQRLTCDEISHIDHIPQFTDVARGLYPLEEVLGLLIQEVQSFPGAMQS